MLTRKIRLVPILLVIALVACGVWSYFHFREPKFKGKSLSAWLREARENGADSDLPAQTDFDSPSARALRAMGTDCLPQLLSNVRVRESGFREEVRKFSEQHDWLPIHPRPFSEIQEETGFAFAVLGPIARPAVPRLIKLLESDAPEVRLLAAFCLSSIGPVSAEVAPALAKYAQWSLQRTNATSNPGGEELFVAAYAMNQLGEAARPALAQIYALTNASNEEARFIAKVALLKLTGQGMPLLLQSLANTNDFPSWLEAARVLQWADTNGAPAVPILINALQPTNDQICLIALETLARIHSSPELSLPALRPLLRSTNASIRWSALEGLRHFKGSPVDAQTIAELKSCLQDSDENVRKHATNALRSLAPEAALRVGIEP